MASSSPYFPGSTTRTTPHYAILVLAIGVIVFSGTQALAQARVKHSDLQLAVPSIARGGRYLCLPSECPFPNQSSILDQLSHLTGCMTGPSDDTQYMCHCGELSMDGHVTLRDFALLQNYPTILCHRQLSVARLPGLGFCPHPGSIYKATVIETLDGSWVLIGTLVVEAGPPPNDCLYDYEPECFVAIPFSPIVLSAEQVETLTALYIAIPPNPRSWPCCDGAADPCVITYIQRVDELVHDFCWPRCKEAIAFQEAFQDFIQYVDEIVSGG